MNLEPKDILLASIAFLGWAWAVVQFYLNRRLQSKDKILDRRYQAYDGYLKKSEEMHQSLRMSSIACLGESHDICAKVVSLKIMTEPEAALALNELFQVVIRKATEPLQFLSAEIASLKLICSPKLLQQIEENQRLTLALHLELMSWLPKIDTAEFETLEAMVVSLYQDPRWKRMAELDREMILLMRTEMSCK